MTGYQAGLKRGTLFFGALRFLLTSNSALAGFASGAAFLLWRPSKLLLRAAACLL